MANVMDFIQGPFRENEVLEELGIAGFKTLVRVSETIERTSEVTMSPVEDGSFIADHIVDNPTILTITGDVSDVFISPSSLAEFKRDIERTIGGVSQYLPNRTQSQLQRVSGIANDFSDKIKQLDSALEKGDNFLSNLQSLTGNESGKIEGNQKKFMDMLDSLRASKTAIKIQSQTRTFNSMIVSSITTDTDNEADSTSFTIVFTELITAKTKTTIVSFKPAAGTGGSIDDIKDKASQKPVPIDENSSVALKVFNAISGLIKG